MLVAAKRPSLFDANEKGDDVAPNIGTNPTLIEIDRLNAECEARYQTQLQLQTSLSRSLVSFQANKQRAVYRWFKYKEAFSAGLVEHLLAQCGVTNGVVLDPFAGVGTALFAASEMGLRAEGIELLPIGQTVITTKKLIDSSFSPSDVKVIAGWAMDRVWQDADGGKPLNELRITAGAYPAETAESIRRYLSALERENRHVREVLFFALLCVLERISFTRKDGQYLRWDYRAGRRVGKRPFDKGRILPFDEAIVAKLNEIVSDLREASRPTDLFATRTQRADITLYQGSCLEILPTLADATYDVIMTSPPYCNRYDYTRTYALELALLGVDEAGLVKLRQEMLSCTVENRAKDLLAMNPNWKDAVAAADQHQLLQTILNYLDRQREANVLNNSGIPRMVRGYFYEMACVIAECGRVLKPNMPLIMVNDNVRYAGASVSVDLILSDFAQQLGFVVERILVLPNGKGNSSQQMATHGRDQLRKCVYIWRKK
jgi:DNA modification methylase